MFKLSNPLPKQLRDPKTALADARAALSQRESTGTFLGRAIFHTWFHTGEINAVRQMLGHPEIMFVGAAGGELAWVPSRAVER